MTNVRVAVPPALDSWMKTRVAQGGYSDEADYIRDLIRRDREAASDDRRHLKMLIDEGLASGVIDSEPTEVIEDIIAQHKANG